MLKFWNEFHFLEIKSNLISALLTIDIISIRVCDKFLSSSIYKWCYLIYSYDLRMAWNATLHLLLSYALWINFENQCQIFLLSYSSRCIRQKGKFVVSLTTISTKKQSIAIFAIAKELNLILKKNFNFLI